MKIEKADLWLTIGLVTIFIVLSATKIDPSIRDALWIAFTVVGLCLHALAVVRKRMTSLAFGLGKVELILFVSQLLGFAAYLLRFRLTHVPVPGNTWLSWLFFYPWLILIGILVACVYPLCFWVARYVSRR